MIENGDLIVRYLERLGVEYVFGVPGGSIEPLFNALARSARRGGPRAVVARHESGAAFMADGYTRATGRIGVCCATSGPGATNLITGVANAYADGIPMLVISAQPAIERFGLGAFQEGSCTGINTLTMFESCTRFNTLVSHPAQVEPKLLMAISYALSNQPGPVHLSIPLDIMRAKVSESVALLNRRAFINHEVVPSWDALHVILKELAYVETATLVLGEGSIGAVDDLLALAESRNWLIVTTPMAKGLVSDFHPLYRGVFGLGGHESARNALLAENAERVIVVGTALDEITTGGWDPKAVLSERLIHLSNNPEHLSRSTMARRCILGSPRLLFQSFAEHLAHDPERAEVQCRPAADGFPAHMTYADKAACLSQSVPIKPQALFWTLNQLVPPNARVLMDTGNSFLWGAHYWHTYQRASCTAQLVHIGMGFATMGWAIGAAVGMALARRDLPVVCFTGDGSVLMNGQEMTVARKYNLNILFIILNDSHLGMIKHGQQLGGAEDIANRLPQVDFAAMARALGLRAHRIERLGQLDEIDVTQVFDEPGPCVLDVLIDANEIPPMQQRSKVLTADSALERISNV